MFQDNLPSIMERSFVLVIVFLSSLVNAQESGSSLNNRISTVVFQESQSSITSHLYPVTSASPYRMVKSEIKFVTMSSLSTERTIAASNVGPNIFQSPVSIVSGPKDSSLKAPSVLQSPTIQQSQALSSSNKQPIAIQTSSDKHTQAPKTSLLPESIGSDAPTAIQSDYLVPIQAKTTQQILTSVAESESSMHYSSTERVAKTVSSRLASSTSTAHASVSKSISTVLLSLRATPARSTVPIQQNSSRIFLQGESQSAQGPAVTSEIQGGTTSHFSASLSLDLVTMTTKGLSFLPVTPSPFSSNVAGYASNATQSFGNTSTELASQGLSTQLLAKSTVMTEVGVSQSGTLIHPTSTQFPAVKTSWQQSSSVMLPPPTASPPGVPDPPVILNVTVLSARSVFLTWNTTSAQSAANYSVEFSNDSFTWKNATCNQSSVPEACIVRHSEAIVSWLKPYTNYTFRVAAENSFGRSNYSGESKLILTDEAAPSSAPTITVAYNTSSEAIFIAWDPPALDTLNGKLRKYQLHLTEISTQPTIMPTSRNSISGLTSSASLLPSSPVPTTPSDSEIPVTTEPHREGKGRSKWQVGSPVFLDVGTAVSYEAHGLKKWTFYEVEVRAVTVAPGPFSNKLSVQTDEDVPSQPTQLSAKAINSMTLFVNWTEPMEMNGVLLKYEVTYTEQGSSKSTTRPVGIGERSAVISSLNAFTFYSINVAAFTRKGRGNQSTVLIQTDEGQPSPPLNLSTQSVNSTAILVFWQQPAHSNGKIKYRLSINTGSQQSAFYQVVYDGNNTQYLVSDLKPFTKYNLQVTAYNVKYNLSSPSVVAMETTGQAAPSGSPENARAVTNSSTSIILHWTPPKTAEQNGEIISYTIYANSSDRSLVKLLNVTGNTTMLAVSGLQPYTDYLFMIQAVTVGGRGPYSHPVTNKTFEAEPSPPRNLTAKSVNSTAVRVKWVEPLHPNGVVQYKLSMRLSTEDESQNKVLYEGSATAFVVSGLEEYVMYTFAVVSVNVKYPWTSTPVVAMETTHPAEPSGAPQDVLTMAKSSTSIIVEWSPPLVSERNGIIIQYTVEYEQDPAGESKSVNTTDNSTSFVVKDLAIFNKYSFKIRAWNVVGEGPESEAVYNTTLEDRPSPPTDLTTHTLNSSAIRVSWQIPQNPNGEIFYRLYYWQNSEGPGSRKLIYDGPLLEYIVAGLHEYVTYTFMLLAYNVRFEWNSTAVNASETTHPAEPSGPPLDVMALTESSTSILVKWNPPSELDRNGVITHYIVTYNESLGSETNITTSDNRTQKLVSSLRKYSPYYFTVQAVNNIGVGPPSVAVINTTAEDIPGQPVLQPDAVVTSNSIEVSWKPPLEPNGIIKTFELCWSDARDVSNPNCPTFNGAMSSYNISDLKPFSQYTIKLAAYTSVGKSPFAARNYSTDEGVPSEPQDLRAWNTSGYSIEVSWKKPLNINGILEGYKVFYSASSSDLSKDVGLNTSTTLIHLKPYTRHKVEVQAFTGAGGGKKTSVSVKTDETAPSKVHEVTIYGTTKNSIDLWWRAPKEPNGEIGYYLYYWRSVSGNSTRKNLTLPKSVEKKIIPDLKAYTNYTIAVVAYNLRKKLGGAPSFVRGRTKAAAPSGPPLNIAVTDITSTSVTVSWDPPVEPNGKIEGYIVKYHKKDNSGTKILYVSGQGYRIENLKPFRIYRISVACKSSGGIGRYSDEIENQTLPDAPPALAPISPPDKGAIQSNSFKVELAKASDENGKVSYYQVIVIELATDNKGKAVPAQPPDYYKGDLYTYDEARKKKPTLVPYIAAEFNAMDFHDYKSFTVGDSRRSSRAKDKTIRRRRKEVNRPFEYFNGPLEGGTLYAVFLRAYVKEDVYSSSPWIDPVETAPAVVPTPKPSESSTNIALIVGLVLVIVIVCILIFVGIIYVRRKRTAFDRVMDDRDDYSNGQPTKMKKLSRKRRSMQKRLMGSTESLDGLDDLAASRARRQPVPIDDFERHVDRMHMDGDHGFSDEYALVQPDEDFSFQQFLNPANKYKNRYANIVAYDHTRVLLNPIEGIAGSDYINANFIDGYNRQRAYIAAQGPLMETFDDFWRMIWEQMSSVIVMLTKLEERGRRKCDQYWPERGMKNYGPIQVTLKETLNMSHYTLRKFIITHKLYPGDDRVIKQFHFTAWPDHGVPSHPTPLLSLVRHTFSANRESVGPMVVHCSAGVGRTGTFITLDVMLQRISLEDSVDVFGFVRQMRYQRNFMVQTEAQYVFIHDALLEAITCGVTEVEAKDLGSRIRELRQFDPETGYTYLENEFCRLAKEENHPIAFKSASLNCNTAKNRYANILPFESTRVHLKMRPGEMGSDYINANFIDGYCQPRAYIATQAPIPDTFDDFWRMIWEQESATVVMLTREEEAGKVKCHRYWPSEGSRLHGGILVELMEEGSYTDYVARKFKMTHTEFKESRTVTQFQYIDWPDTGLPDSGVGIVDLIGQVQKWQQQSGNSIIVIHCSGGVGRTGVFCGISMMIERLKAEGVIDVFQTVQAMRLQRPAMVQTAEQYEFCYTTLQEYLDSFDLYANFQ